MKLKIRDEETTIQDGDMLVIFLRHETAGFLREGTPLKSLSGDDKFLAHYECIHHMLSFLGYSVTFIEDKVDIKIYKIHLR